MIGEIKRKDEKGDGGCAVEPVIASRGGLISKLQELEGVKQK